MNDEQLLRYSRQILLPDIDLDGQEKLLQSRVLIVGLGGLGAPVSLYLAAAGVGHLVLADFDAVELSNLQRQIVHTTARIGYAKVQSAAQALRELNPQVQLTLMEQKLTLGLLHEQVRAVDLVLDCTDNFAIRQAINAACVAARVPLVSGAAIRLEGQVAVFDARDIHSPCYRCLYDEEQDEQQNCATHGVLAPLVGVVGSLQAVEALKLLAGFGKSLSGRVLLFDAGSSHWRELRLLKDPACPVCGTGVS